MEFFNANRLILCAMRAKADCMEHSLNALWNELVIECIELKQN